MTRLPILAVLAAGMLALGGPSGAAETGAGVPAHHGGPARGGQYVVAGLTWTRAGSAHLERAFDGQVQGHVYAQPLYWRPPGAAGGLLIVATESNIVHALDARTGREVWRQVLGPAVPRAALPCGNIDPMGITGTPVIDAAREALYLDAMVEQDGAPQHLVFGLSLRTGVVLPGWPVAVAAALRARGMTFDPRVQGQRGALALAGDRLYVPFGGHFGDCGDYHGWVVGLHVGRPALFGSWQTTARKGGIWAAGGISFDGRFLYAATGNTEGAGEWGGGEAVIRLPPDLQWRPDPANYFAPADWHDLDDADADLGGTNPLPIDLPAGRGPSALLLAMGKDGKAYLLDRGDLGGIGHALAIRRVADRAIITAPAVWRDGADVLVAFQGRPSACPGGMQGTGLAALRISGGERMDISTAWCARLNGRGAPMVTTAGRGVDPIVWIVGAEGDDRLHGFRGDTGQPVFDGGAAGEQMAGLRRFATIIAAEGRLYVAGDGRVYAFGFAATRP
jgi:hypothetical protein